MHSTVFPTKGRKPLLTVVLIAVNFKLHIARLYQKKSQRLIDCTAAFKYNLKKVTFYILVCHDFYCVSVTPVLSGQPDSMRA